MIAPIDLNPVRAKVYKLPENTRVPMTKSAPAQEEMRAREKRKSQCCQDKRECMVHLVVCPHLKDG